METDFTQYEGFVNFYETPVFSTLLKLRNRIVMIITGNRFGKTKTIQRKNVYRLMGLSPNPEHNIKPEDRCRVVRLAAENLPGDSEREVRNTIYPALMEQIPKGLVLKDITIRKPLVTCQPLLGGKPLQFEFVSYGQTTQSHGGVDRLWIDTDEVCDYDFYEESMPRLATTNGQFFVGTTPIEAGWMYDELFCKAKTIYRTKNVRKYMKEAMGVTVGAIEHTDSKEDIAVIQAATNSQIIVWKFSNTNDVAGAATVYGGVNGISTTTANAVTMKLTGECAHANDVITLDLWLVEPM